MSDVIKFPTKTELESLDPELAEMLVNVDENEIKDILRDVYNEVLADALKIILTSKAVK